MTDWYPKTTEDVMKLPEGRSIAIKEIDCPRCRTRIQIPIARRIGIQAIHEDAVMFITDHREGCQWWPKWDDERGWYRERR